jgi:hypothetical protein
VFTDAARTAWKRCYPNSCGVHGIPDYFNDLNAVHELEKYLTQEQANSFGDHLANSKQDGTWAGCHIWHQSAAQRCEALGLTLKIWK